MTTAPEEPAGASRYDVVVVGAGHNGLVAAAYLAGAGLSVLVLERLGGTGGATTSHEPFAGLPARISPYATLVGHFPTPLLRDLGVDVGLRARRTLTYAPVERDGRMTGLLVEAAPTEAMAESFRAVTGSQHDHDAWRSFHGRLAEVAEVLAPTLLEPLHRRREVAAALDPQAWRDLVETPLAAVLERTFADDLTRGVVATGGLLGESLDLHDPGLEQNRCFLHHTLAAATGGWRLPVGGMGALATALEGAARRAGARLVTRAFVERVATDGRSAQVTWRDGDGTRTSVDCTWVLGAVAPWVLAVMLGEDPGPRPEGALLKVDMLVERLPRLRSGVSATTAFAGSVMVASSLTALQRSYAEARTGAPPTEPPGLLSCPSLADPSVLGPLAVQGKHAFSFVGLHAPATLFDADAEERRDDYVMRVLDAVNLHLQEPLESLLTLDRDGQPCLQARSARDLERALALPGGHPFHGPLSWPWVGDRSSLATPAEQWGVGTAHPNVLLCGAGALRGGTVSGVGGHNAAMAVLGSPGLRPVG